MPLQSTTTVTGRLLDERHVELDEPVGRAGDPVQVTVRLVSQTGPAAAAAMRAYFDSLPAEGSRTIEQINRDLREERDGWGDR